MGDDDIEDGTVDIDIGVDGDVDDKEIDALLILIESKSGVNEDELRRLSR